MRRLLRTWLDRVDARDREHAAYLAAPDPIRTAYLAGYARGLADAPLIRS